MLTAIQLRKGDVNCSLLYGEPDYTKPGSLGDIAIFRTCKVVVYCISTSKKKKAFLFKTLQNGGTKVPGVMPEISLLCEAGSKGKVGRLMQVLTSLERKGVAVSDLPDGFFLRLNVILGNRFFSISSAMEMFSHAKL